MQSKVSLERSAATRVYVGIDVCKGWLDVYVHPIGRAFRVPNTREGLKQLKRSLAGLSVALIAMEATGKFHREAHRDLHASGFAIAVVNPLRSRLFAEAAGQLGKTDKVDARMLALLAAMIEPKAKPPPAQAIETLQEVVRGREAFVAQRTALLNQLAAPRRLASSARSGVSSKRSKVPSRASRPRSSAASPPALRWRGALPSSSRFQASVPSLRPPCWRTFPRSARVAPSSPP